MTEWMLYGATGYTGRLVAEAAVRRGHRPLLAGRSADKLRPLAERLGLEWIAVSLEDADGLRRAVAQVGLVYHAAGPFLHTAQPMVHACLAEGAHYLDITGEIPVYQMVFGLDTAARERGVALLSGVGFDVVPSDGLIRYVADRLPGADRLEVVVDALGTGDGAARVSAGTTKSMLELIAAQGNVVRRDGRLVRIPFGAAPRRFRFPHGERLAMPAPWGDVEMAYHSTGIPNITAYLAFSPALVGLFALTGPVVGLMLKPAGVRRLLGRAIDRLVAGPSEAARDQGRSWVYARASRADGRYAEAWLETIEGYQFTAEIGVRAVERVLDSSLRGAFTPSQAFGADFALEVEGTRRYDALPG